MREDMHTLDGEIKGDCLCGHAEGEHDGAEHAYRLCNHRPGNCLCDGFSAKTYGAKANAPDSSPSGPCESRSRLSTLAARTN
jgi:hypothetical protein